MIRRSLVSEINYGDGRLPSFTEMTVRMTPQDPQIATDSDHTGLDAGSSNLWNDRIIKLENQVRLLADENRRLNRQWQEATTAVCCFKKAICQRRPSTDSGHQPHRWRGYRTSRSRYGQPAYF